VTVGSSGATGINVSMPLGVTISGTVYGPNGITPLANINVHPYSGTFDAWTQTDSNGAYSIAVLPGDYTLPFHDFTGTYVNGCYSSSISPGHFTTNQGACTPVAVAGSNVGGINVVLTPQGATYHPITPVRLLDTRSGNGLAGNTPAKLQANTPVTFQITGRNGIPSNATAVTGNVTVVGSTYSWAVYLGPVATASPGSSTINFNAGDIKANNLTVALGAGGTLSATYMSFAGNTTDLVFDVTGYYTSDLTGARYVPLTPARLVDSRSNNGITGQLSANTPATFGVSGRGGVPIYATAVSGNVTVVNETDSWAVFVGPNPTASPGSSTLNFNKGDIVANGLTVALGSGGTLSATYMSFAGNKTDLVFDVTGYFVLAGG
jgi:hypothetical protein